MQMGSFLGPFGQCRLGRKKKKVKKKRKIQLWINNQTVNYEEVHPTAAPHPDQVIGHVRFDWPELIT